MNDEIKLINLVKQYCYIKVSDLCKLTGWTDRYIRELRQNISKNPEKFGCILCQNSRDGYYITDEKDKIEEYIADLRSRAKDLWEQADKVEKWIFKKLENEKQLILF